MNIEVVKNRLLYYGNKLKIKDELKDLIQTNPKNIISIYINEQKTKGVVKYIKLLYKYNKPILSNSYRVHLVDEEFKKDINIFIELFKYLKLLINKKEIENRLNNLNNKLFKIEKSKITNRKRELIKLNEYLKSKLPSDISPKNVSQFRRAFKKGDTNIIKKDKFYYVIKDFDYSYLFENSKFKEFF